MAATTADLVNEYIDLEDQRKGKEGEIDKIKERLAELEPQIMERFENAGMQSMKSKQGTVIYIRRDLWAGAKEGADVLLLEALKSVGLGDMVKEKVNTQTLSAYVREQEKEQFGATVTATPEEILGVLPEGLRGAVHITERFSLRTKRG
jgi:DNA-binding ferritin-like protein